MTDNIISLDEKKKLREKIKQSMPDDSAYVLVVIPAGTGTTGEAFIEYDERMNPYEVIGFLEFGKALMLASAEDE